MEEMFHRGDVLRALRDQRGWSQKQLAERAGFNVATVNRAEQNKSNVGDEVWTKLAACLNVSADWLLTAHAEPTAGPGVTLPVTPGTQTAATPPSEDTPMTTPHTAAKERLEYFVKSLPPAIAAEIEQGVWRLAFKAQLLRDGAAAQASPEKK